MKKIPKQDWYLDAYTWCGVNKNGERWYPVSYGDNGTAWRKTTDINHCLDFPNTDSVARMLKAELKYDLWFKHDYTAVELIKIKVYPSGWFDYRRIAEKLNITEFNDSMRQDEARELLEKYGLKKIPEDEQVLEVSRDNGEFYAKIKSENSSHLDRIKQLTLEQSVFSGTTYLMRTYEDAELLCEHIEHAEILCDLFDEEEQCLYDYTGKIHFPCFMVIKDKHMNVYSISDAKELIADANAMLKIIEELEETK